MEYRKPGNSGLNVSVIGLVTNNFGNPNRIPDPAQKLLQEIRDQVRDHGLADRVQATPCRCIFGCTYGPRIDVINRATGEKVLYGSLEAPVVISVRGRVDMKKIPDQLIEIAQDNLTRSNPGAG